ncbi:HAMP domain-containing protein [Paraburkholderia sp. UYCP14C]|uniref:methyl-accepting chemotaxis protein n=1 Tax=Paraburkholderia sp. UYCP14C TaxID=2511130 RepID=UPI0010212913|nr:methyl-accepting chemotaxis protein [Paraburkholderia sp. UYCP14C]RZF24809.1 HAMP domain-containing protein [Paraburkholderia sp. UYCP14C]
MSTIQLDPTADDTKKIFTDAEQNIGKWGDAMGSLLASADGGEKFKTLIEGWKAYDRKSRQTIELATHDAKAANEQVTAIYHSDFQPFQALLEQNVAQSAERARETAASADRARANMMYIVIAVMILGLAIVSGSIWALSRTILKALNNIQSTLQQASETLDLSQRVPIDTMDEIGIAAAAYNELMSRVVEVLVTVWESTESVSVAAKEIAAGNIDLSSRTEEQAASLEQTAASMEELTGTVRQNADNARQASTLAANASGIAEEGSGVVQRVVSTMDEIKDSSSKIADIIGIIEGIAFQTNILALNAAVEAARAGEQGRGFAVVAGEVRSLAQRSSTAAKEIKALIDTSVTRVRTGVDLVDQAGATMQQINVAVTRVTDIMGEIAAASDEQSKGIDQVGQAVTQMDEVTQQNAALVEEAAAAAQSLDDQAAKLKTAVATFRLGDGAASTPVLSRVPVGRAAVPAIAHAAVKSRTEPKNQPRTHARASPVATPALAEASGDWQTF